MRQNLKLARVRNEKMKVNPKYYRPAEVEILLGNHAKAERQLGWRREIPFTEMVERMVGNDLRIVGCRKESL